MWNQTQTAPETKLTALRARTDGQLIAYLNKRLETALRSDVFTAEQVYEEVRHLLPVAYGATAAERQAVQSKLAHLGDVLPCVCRSVA